MKIGVDLRVLARGAQTGVEQYTCGLMRALAGDEKNDYRFFYNAWQKEKLTFPWLNGLQKKLFDFHCPNKFLDLSVRAFNRPFFDEKIGGADVYFTPHFLRSALKKAKRVVTFHDLSFEYYPEFFSSRQRLWHRLVNPRQRAQEADLIVAVSSSTKSDLVNLYKIPAEKIKVIYSGVEAAPTDKLTDDNFSVLCRKYQLPQKFILYFGTIEPRKNLAGLIEAFEILKTNKKFADWHLVLAGSFGWLFKKTLQKARQSTQARFIHFPGFIDAQDKFPLYRAAELFVYPSFFEGFGFPPLEAMACQTPVICSNKTSLPEVVGEAALMVDPGLPGELAEAIKMLTEQDDFRKELVARGQKQARRFSWEKTARDFLETINLLK